MNNDRTPTLDQVQAAHERLRVVRSAILSDVRRLVTSSADFEMLMEDLRLLLDTEARVRESLSDLHYD